jgi:hypothetical protein
VQVPYPGSEPNRGIRALMFGAYFQDDFRITPRFTLNLGLRYELTTVPVEVNNKMSFLLHPGDTALQFSPPFAGNHKNFAPRFGFAWDPQGNGRTSIRGGFGVFYDQIVLNQFLNMFDRNPSPDFKSLWLTTTLLGAAAPFPHPLEAALGAPQFTLQNAVYDDFKTPYLYQYNLTIQRQLPGKVIGSIAYVGSQSCAGSESKSDQRSLARLRRHTRRDACRNSNSFFRSVRIRAAAVGHLRQPGAKHAHWPGDRGGGLLGCEDFHRA